MPSIQTGEFQGGHDTFVFSLHPKARHFNSTMKNEMIMLCEYDYMTVGVKGEIGDGPALRFDDTLKVGRSYKSETFEN